MSVRTRDHSAPGSETRTSHDYDKDGVRTGSRSDSISWLNLDRMVDTVTPGFQVRRRNGEVFNSPMSKSKSSGRAIKRPVTVQYPPVSGKRPKWVTEAFWTAPKGQPSDPVYGLPADVLSAAQRLMAATITEAYAKVGAPDISALVSLGEIPETLAFLWSPVKSMVNLTRRAKTWLQAAIRRQKRYEDQLDRYWSLPERIRKRRQPPEKPKNPPFRVGNFQATDISSFWLAYRYGLMPLIYEFQAWEKVLTEAWNTVPRATARGTASTVVETTLRDGTASGGGLTFRTTDVNTCKIVVRSGVLYEPSVEWTTRFGIQLNRVPAAMYELFPLSFVADWFWNGAEVYDALTAECRTQRILAAWSSVSFIYEHRTSRTIVSVDPTHLVQGVGGVCFVEEGEWKTRSPKSLQDVRVQMRLELNAKRIADGLALIHQFLSPGKKPRV